MLIGVLNYFYAIADNFNEIEVKLFFFQFFHFYARFYFKSGDGQI